MNHRLLECVCALSAWMNEALLTTSPTVRRIADCLTGLSLLRFFSSATSQTPANTQETDTAKHFLMTQSPEEKRGWIQEADARLCSALPPTQRKPDRGAAGGGISQTKHLNDVCKSPHPNTDTSYVFPWSRNDAYWRITLWTIQHTDLTVIWSLKWSFTFLL